MYGFLLGFIGTFFEETNNSIIKKQSSNYNYFQLGLITSFFGMIFFLLYSFVKVFILGKEIYVNPNSFSFLGIRIVLEILQSYFTILAIEKTDRSTFSIIRILTIPGLLLVDIILGYNFSLFSILGLIIVLISFIIIAFSNGKINFKGWKYILFTTLNAIVTISLFKYSISVYGNSVEFDQFIILIFLIIFYLSVFLKNKYKIPNIFKDKIFLIQGMSIGFATILLSFSILFLNSSIAIAIKRGGAMFWSIIFGYKFFQEKNIKFKLLIAILIFIGLILTIF